MQAGYTIASDGGFREPGRSCQHGLQLATPAFSLRQNATLGPREVIKSIHLAIYMTPIAGTLGIFTKKLKTAPPERR